MNDAPDPGLAGGGEQDPRIPDRVRVGEPAPRKADPIGVEQRVDTLQRPGEGPWVVEGEWMRRKAAAERVAAVGVVGEVDDVVAAGDQPGGDVATGEPEGPRD